MVQEAEEAEELRERGGPAGEERADQEAPGAGVHLVVCSRSSDVLISLESITRLSDGLEDFPSRIERGSLLVSHSMLYLLGEMASLQM